MEQVIATSPQESLRYRVIEGSPLTGHQGEITLKQSGGHTELHWSIRFRPKVAGTGALLQKVLQASCAPCWTNTSSPTSKPAPLRFGEHQPTQR